MHMRIYCSRATGSCNHHLHIQTLCILLGFLSHGNRCLWMRIKCVLVFHREGMKLFTKTLSSETFRDETVFRSFIAEGTNIYLFSASPSILKPTLWMSLAVNWPALLHGMHIQTDTHTYTHLHPLMWPDHSHLTGRCHRLHDWFVLFSLQRDAHHT